jgi:hypothetical protein
MANKSAVQAHDLPATINTLQRSDCDPIGFVVGINYHHQPRCLLLAIRLFSFGYRVWLQSGECTLSENIKKIIHQYQRKIEKGLSPMRKGQQTAYNHAGLKMLSVYADYQRWLYGLGDGDALYDHPQFETYKLLSAPLSRCGYITPHSAERMAAAGIHSLHQMLLTLTYPEMRMLGYLSHKEAARLFPRLQRLGVFPIVGKREILVTADQLLDAIYELKHGAA